MFKLFNSWNTFGHAFPILIAYNQNRKRILVRHLHDSSNSLYWFNPISQSIEVAEIGGIHSASELCYEYDHSLRWLGAKGMVFDITHGEYKKLKRR